MPLSTTVTTFDRVVDYRTYRLQNKTSILTAVEAMCFHRLKKNTDGLHPALREFSGNTAINLISFLYVMKDALDMSGASEAINLRDITNYLEEEARDVHEEQLCSVTGDPEEEVFGNSV